jgi:hypothetical protein
LLIALHFDFKFFLCYSSEKRPIIFMVKKKGIGRQRLVKKLINLLGEPYSSHLGIDLESKEESEIFKWFLASFLFGKRIGEGIAARTYRLFASKNITTPDKILTTGWDGLVAVLDEGGYVRYDFSTAEKTKCRSFHKKGLENQIQK